MDNPFKVLGAKTDDLGHFIARKVKIEMYEEAVMDALGRLRQLNPDKAGTYDTVVEMMKTAGAD